MNRRKRRRRKPYRNTNLKNSALSVLLVICFSVAAGYITASYILGPILGLDMKPSFFQSIKETENITEEKTEEKTDEKTVIEDKVEAELESGFAIQYGSFSAKKGAQELMKELKNSGIEARIVEMDGMFKVIGEIFDTKDEARTHMENSPHDQEVFITQIP